MLLAAHGSAHASNAVQQGHNCHLPGYDQTLRCITVKVPLDYADPDAQSIPIQVTLAPALREAARPDPVFVLAGGPGQAGSEVLPVIDTAFRKLRATRDLVFIDQRGTGLSGKLDCDSKEAIEDSPIDEQGKLIANCMQKLNKPFAFYNTANSARDIEQIRTALGYGQIDVWGASYGTRLGQAYARLFPGSVRALILDGVASPDQIIFNWGRDAQAALDAVFKSCADDHDCHATFPTLPQQFAGLVKRVNAGEVNLDFMHPRTAAHIKMQLPPERFLQTVRTALYSPEIASRLPYLINSADQGNWAPFLAQMYSSSDFSLDGPSTGLMLSVTCAEDIPRITPAIVTEEEHDSFMGGIEVKLLPQWCRAVNVPPIAYQAPASIDAPVLLFSGGRDPVTPPRRAEAAAKLMTHAQHFVVANAAHGVSQLGCAPRLIREFLDQPNQPLAAKCLQEIAPIGFQLDAAGPHP
jgi:pimeloyl-ACP methyl ester carboxylesterase